MPQFKIHADTSPLLYLPSVIDIGKQMQLKEKNITTLKVTVYFHVDVLSSDKPYRYLEENYLGLLQDRNFFGDF